MKDELLSVEEQGKEFLRKGQRLAEGIDVDEAPFLSKVVRLLIVAVQAQTASIFSSDDLSPFSDMHVQEQCG